MLAATLEYYLTGWDRTFLDLSSKMAEPFCAVWSAFRYRLIAPLDPQKFENYSSVTKEIAFRGFIGLGGVLGVCLIYAIPVATLGSISVLGVGSRAFRALGFALQKGGYTHVRGIAPEKALNHEDPQVKVMSWNICGLGGGMSLDHGGVIHWRSRLGAIVNKIKTEDPDVLILQEVYDTALAEALIEKLQDKYAHFFMHLGPNMWGISGGCMVISKCAVHDFSHTSFTNNHWTMNRGFAILEIKADSLEALPCARIVGTHLIHGDQHEDKAKRMIQVSQIVNQMARKPLAIPTVLAGDLNMERDQEEGAQLSPHFRHGYQGAQPTCTNRLTAQWDSKPKSIWNETIDYISLFKRNLLESSTLENCHLVKAYDDTYNTRTAVSDHHGLSAVITGVKQRDL